MSKVLKIKCSADPNKVPTPALLQVGEFAFNTADKRLYLGSVGGVSEIQMTGERSTRILDTSGAITLDWSKSEVFHQDAPTGLITYQFISPARAQRLLLVIDAEPSTAATSFSFPSNVVWLRQTWGRVAGKKSLLTLYYDGFDYFIEGINEA